MVRKSRGWVGVIVLLIVGAFAAPSSIVAQGNSPGSYRLEPFVTAGLDRPIFLTTAGDDTGRLFMLAQPGVIRLIENGRLLPTPFLDISDRTILMEEYSEQGLLGLAFHPDYEQNGYFYVNYTDRVGFGNTIIARYQVAADDPNRADLASETILLRVEQPGVNHNGGMVLFGPDGYLYIGLGDGGPQGDLSNNGQNKFALLGKILRIDVDNGDPYAIPPNNPFADGVHGAPEVWAYGLRNPYRFSFDSLTHDLYIGDVGEEQIEEVNFQPADSQGGENYGWKLYEGSQVYNGPFSEPANVPQIKDSLTVPPVAEYPHSMGCAVAGGYVYRGTALPDLVGVYLYGDWCTGRIWWLKRGDDGAWDGGLLMENTGLLITSFGQDDAGELYVVDHNGGIYRLVAG